ncbi:Cytidine deaminase [Rhodococcus sp. B7740]|uniref:hypothetical protein n=1 Tax=Rhodococcus sp. B7740 TaxID=1564114 RepID=UPI0005D89953|nr:hypothetical protein [Rhodococcus sp. B7740]AJW41966.1 Cytidine deaminase [Rhodococcus sp. B7740]
MSDDNFGPELIFAIVRPVGVDRDGVVAAFKRQLDSFGYQLEHIRLSAAIEDWLPDTVDVPVNTYDRIKFLIEQGDKICELNSSSAALAATAIASIKRSRSNDGVEPPKRRQRVAYLIDSVKRTQEAALLKRVYGERYIQVALMSHESLRREYLVEKFRTENFSEGIGVHEQHAMDLIGIDQKEGTLFGQNVSKVFPKSDLFVNADEDVEDQLERFLNLMFNSPDYVPPSVVEFGMNMAYIASTRSAELGLKVGAAILDAKNHVLSLGCNSHPTKPDEAPQFDRSRISIKELVLDTLRRARSLLKEEHSVRLGSEPEAFVTELLGDGGYLEDAQLQDLTEFQLPVHAEMAAILDGLHRGGISEGDTLYVTAYPCHNCAKHLMAAKLNVVYLEPYPKSKAESMYGSAFTAFQGIAPKRYDTLFRVGGDRKDKDGARLAWSYNERAKALPKVGQFDEYQASEHEREIAALSEELTGMDGTDLGEEQIEGEVDVHQQ